MKVESRYQNFATVLPGRINWASGLFECRVNPAFPSNPPTYSCSLLVEKSDPKVAEFLKVIQAIIEESFEGERPSKAFFPIKATEDPDVLELKMKASERHPPMVVNQVNQVLDQPGLIKSGDWVDVYVKLFIYTYITLLNFNSINIVS